MPNEGDNSFTRGAQKPGPANPNSADAELMKDLSSFRKETMKVSDEDKDKWNKEAKKIGASGPVNTPSKVAEAEEAKKEETRWDRIQREQRKKQIAFGLLCACGLLLVIQSDVGGRLRGLFARGPKPQATPTAAPLPPAAPVDQTLLAEGFLVCRYELRLLASKPEFKPVAEEPYRYDWSTLKGPACMFSPTRQTDPTERYNELTGGERPPARVQLVDTLARFVRAAARPAEKLLADTILGDLASVRQRASRLFEVQESFATSKAVTDPGPGLLAAGLAELDGGDEAKGRGYLERAVSETQGSDPWPARALMLYDLSRGKPAEALPALERRQTANPKDELQGYQLAWAYVQAGKPADADRILTALEALPLGDEARLVRAVRLASAKDWTALDALMAKVETGLATKSPQLKARFAALKAQALLARDPNQTPLARDLFVKGRDQDPTCTWADLTLARLFAKEKQLPEAASSYRRYLRRFPGAVATRRELASLLIEGRYFAQALGEYAELVMADGGKDEYVKAITFVGSALGRPDIVRYLLDRARAR